jgi:hypothetical protein
MLGGVVVGGQTWGHCRLGTRQEGGEMVLDPQDADPQDPLPPEQPQDPLLPELHEHELPELDPQVSQLAIRTMRMSVRIIFFINNNIPFPFSFHL